jgi:hypothetical protein
MASRATCVCQEPLDYFLQTGDEGPHLRVSDVILRCNHNPREILSHFIRLASNSKWSHSALVYLLNDPPKGFNNTFLVEAMMTGIRMASWRNEVVPYEQFTVGIKRPRLEWYIETPYEISKHDSHDPEDEHGIGFLRHVRGIAIDQINGLYDHKAVYELTALYVERVARRRLSRIPQVAEAAETVARLFRKWDESDTSRTTILRFMCSGLIQYSFFEALRRRLINDFAIPEHRDAALSNLSNMQRIMFREDPEGAVPEYVHLAQSGKLDIADPVPYQVLNLLKTSLPADFNNSCHLEWRYVIQEGIVWKIDEVADGYLPQSKDEEEVLAMLNRECCDDDEHYLQREISGTLQG